MNSCPRCQSETMEKWIRLDGIPMLFCPNCNWAGDEWTIQTISQLYSRIDELEKHIKELGSEAVDNMMRVQENELPIRAAALPRCEETRNNAALRNH